MQPVGAEVYGMFGDARLVCGGARHVCNGARHACSCV